MKDKITVALIGAGRIGQEHAKGLASRTELLLHFQRTVSQLDYSWGWHPRLKSNCAFGAWAKGPQEKGLGWSAAEPQVFQNRQPSAESVTEGRLRGVAGSLRNDALQS